MSKELVPPLIGPLLYGLFELTVGESMSSLMTATRLGSIAFAESIS
jgi:hypothetical protein